MHKLILATVAILLAGSFVWKAEAAMTTGVRSLPLMNSYTTIEKIGWKRRYRRGYYLWLSLLRLWLQAVRLLRLWL
jgi:hypothetical protein